MVTATLLLLSVSHLLLLDFLRTCVSSLLLLVHMSLLIFCYTQWFWCLLLLLLRLLIYKNFFLLVLLGVEASGKATPQGPFPWYAGV
jgi:hypothetical protein